MTSNSAFHGQELV